MNKRVLFNELLKNSCSVTGVYYQAPNNLKLRPPYIVYDIDDFNINHANNNAYSLHDVYAVTLVTTDPDDLNIEILRGLKYSSFNRHYVVDMLHHYVFTIYD